MATVQEIIDQLTSETFENEKEYSLDVKDKEGNTYTITGYDWCNQTLLVSKDEE